MISVIITTYREIETLPAAIQAIKEQGLQLEILIVAPDNETEELVKSKYSEIVFLHNPKITKPSALNLAIPTAKGDIIILTDGDVAIKKNSFKILLEHFTDSRVGLVCGQPVSSNPRNQIFGFWSHFLTAAADYHRKHDINFSGCGQLYALRKNLFLGLPDETMVDDAWITQMVRQQNYQVVYEPQAQVLVKYPDNFQDWLKQKVRATGGYLEKGHLRKMRNLWQEAKNGIRLFFTYPRSPLEIYWLVLLYLSRLYLWLLIYWKIGLQKKGSQELWQRVESTKKIN
jgi:cellulose synthase/poly-beta-1,6-N-acetylglucosamine synthase-like glycosyltransferase